MFNVDVFPPMICFGPSLILAAAFVAVFWRGDVSRLRHWLGAQVICCGADGVAALNADLATISLLAVLAVCGWTRCPPIRFAPASCRSWPSDS